MVNSRRQFRHPSNQALLEALSDGAQMFVPALWPLEVSNALLVLARRKKLVEAERAAALLAPQKLRVKIVLKWRPLLSRRFPLLLPSTS
jgi:hypothetical protein